jgi:predicted Zn-ribbon and HTH transcriptional regulator
VGDFWKESGLGTRRGPKTRRPAPTCKTHGIPKVQQTAKTPYRCPECEREEWAAAR